LKGEDGLGDDDVLHHVVQVVAGVPVLIVNGDSTSERFRRSATFAHLALAPESWRNDGESQENSSGMFQVEAIDAVDLHQVEAFSDYQVVLLCDVPRLSTSVAERLAVFVHQGGGLGVFTGPRCEPDFYNAWTIDIENDAENSQSSSEQSVTPTTLAQRVTSSPQAERTLGMDFDSVSDRHLKRLIETGQHDLTKLQATTHWRLEKRSEDDAIQVGARLTNGDPLFVEQQFGRGRVMMLALTLDGLENNLIRRSSFPVLLHIWTDHLANADRVDLNYRPHRDLVVRVPSKDLFGMDDLTLKTPDGSTRSVDAEQLDTSMSVEIGLADTPGVYYLAGHNDSEDPTLPFTVLCDPNEFDLTSASDEKLAELGESLQIRWIDDVDQLSLFARGAPTRIELWKLFAVLALVMLVAETAVTRWVAIRRRATVAETYDQTMAAGTPNQATPLEENDGRRAVGSATPPRSWEEVRS
jgi:hypothetical protein